MKPIPVVEVGEGSQKPHRLVANTGNHSVEVNVRIRKNGDHTPVTSSTPRVTPTPSQSLNFRRGSWADMLHRPSKAHLDTKPREYNGKHSGYLPAVESRKVIHISSSGTQTDGQKYIHQSAIGTQTDPQKYFQTEIRKYQSTAWTQTTESQENDIPLPSIKDYTETISQLFQLSSKLKEELSELEIAKDRMEAQLLSIIHEKDLIIASHYKSLSPAPSTGTYTLPSPQQFQDVAVSTDLTKFRGAIREVRNILQQEIFDLQKRSESPLPPPDPRLEKFFGDMNFSDIDLSEFGSGDRGGQYADPGSERIEKFEQSLYQSSSSSSVDNSAVGDYTDVDRTSTQYLDLPTSNFMSLNPPKS